MRTVICAVLLGLLTASAYALNNRSAVSVSGSDLNSCAVTSPCRSFSTALANTADGGEVIALDSAGYGPFTVNQSVTVSGAPGVHAAITASMGDGIGITAGDVTLRNLVLIGTATANNGITNSGSGTLHIINCFIRGFPEDGISSSSAAIYVDHVHVQGNRFGIVVSFGSARINECAFDSNLQIGIDILADVRMDVVKTFVSGSQAGVNVVAPTPSLNPKITLDRCSLSLNADGIRAVGTNASTVWLTNSAFFHNSIDLSTGTGVTIYTYGNNTIENVGTATLTTLAQQ